MPNINNDAQRELELSVTDVIDLIDTGRDRMDSPEAIAVDICGVSDEAIAKKKNDTTGPGTVKKAEVRQHRVDMIFRVKQAKDEGIKFLKFGQTLPEGHDGIVIAATRFDKEESILYVGWAFCRPVDNRDRKDGDIFDRVFGMNMALTNLKIQISGYAADADVDANLYEFLLNKLERIDLDQPKKRASWYNGRNVVARIRHEDKAYALGRKAGAASVGVVSIEGVPVRVEKPV